MNNNNLDSEIIKEELINELEKKVKNGNQEIKKEENEKNKKDDNLKNFFLI
jgi:hypothetical protein